MQNPKIQYLLIVNQPKGLIVRNTPRPETQGGVALYTVPVGYPLYAYNIISIQGVRYGWIVPRVEDRLEWVRVQEAGIDGLKYVDVTNLEDAQNDPNFAIAQALEHIARAIEGK